jgi:hypothetical protein
MCSKGTSRWRSKAGRWSWSGPANLSSSPADTPQTGYYRSPTARLRAVVFYVSEPGRPFLDPLA